MLLETLNSAILEMAEIKVSGKRSTFMREVVLYTRSSGITIKIRV